MIIYRFFSVISRVNCNHSWKREGEIVRTREHDNDSFGLVWVWTKYSNKERERQKMSKNWTKYLDFSNYFSTNNNFRITKITRQFHDENFIQECTPIARDIFISRRLRALEQRYLLFQIILNPRQLRNYRWRSIWRMILYHW